jgi:hypothetical protein
VAYASADRTEVISNSIYNESVIFIASYQQVLVLTDIQTERSSKDSLDCSDQTNIFSIEDSDIWIIACSNNITLILWVPKCKNIIDLSAIEPNKIVGIDIDQDWLI